MENYPVEFEEENTHRLLNNIKFYLDGLQTDLLQLDNLISYTQDNSGLTIRGEVNNLQSQLQVCKFTARKIYNIVENSRYSGKNHQQYLDNINEINQKCADIQNNIDTFINMQGDEEVQENLSFTMAANYLTEQDLNATAGKKKSFDSNFIKKSPKRSMETELFTIQKTNIRQEVNKKMDYSSCSESDKDFNERNSDDNDDNHRGKRGKYRKYSVKLKRNAIYKAMELKDVSKAAKAIGVPIKNLKRWMATGPIRRKGGRKTQDPIMENQQHEWIKEFQAKKETFPTSRQIKTKAIKLSSFKSTFKASKGWLEKFQTRHGLTKKKSQPRVQEESDEGIPDYGNAQFDGNNNSRCNMSHEKEIFYSDSSGNKNKIENILNRDN